ncbi:MAG TPA: DUF6252 family protein [Mucilaginibacter sp.]|jgi:hypothetical protein
MKSAIFLSVIACLLLAACKKDNPSTINGVTFVKNAKTWSTTNVGTGFKPLNTKDTLFIRAQDGEDNIIIAIKQRGAGTYRPDEFRAYYYVTIGMDVIVGQYQTYNDPGNSLEISTYDENNHIIKGTFKFVLTSYYIYSNASTRKIAFTNGKINTQLSDVYFNPFH